MGMDMRLLTFIHISDLHIGDLDPETFDARAPRIWANSKRFDGLLGHSYRSLVRLEQFFNRIRRDEKAQLIVTGDVTTVGSSAQFETVSNFLGSVLRPPKAAYL